MPALSINFWERYSAASDTTLTVNLSILTFRCEHNVMIRFALVSLLIFGVSSHIVALEAEKTPDNRDSNDVQNINSWRKECFEKNNLGACTTLANALKGTTNNAERQKALMALCQGRDGASCLYLGRAAEESHAVEDATVWYRKACDLGVEHGQGCVAMAKLAANQKNEKNTQIWLKKACSHGDTASCKLTK